MQIKAAETEAQVEPLSSANHGTSIWHPRPLDLSESMFKPSIPLLMSTNMTLGVLAQRSLPSMLAQHPT